MWKITRRHLLAHRLRLALTLVAVGIGVAFVSGSLVLTDTVGNVLHGKLATAVPGLDVQVTGKDSHGLSEDQADAVGRVNGVERVAGTVTGYAGVVGSDGKVVTRGGQPSGVNWSGGPGRTLTAGRAPERSGEFALDRQSAERGHLRVGDTVTVIVGGDSSRQHLVGLFTQARGLDDGTTAAFDTATAQVVYGSRGRFDNVVVTAAAGVGQAELAERIRDAVPGVKTKTGSTLLHDANAVIDRQLGAFQKFLLAFAVIALTVGSLVIVNTFTVLVAQRTREIALLRLAGATGRQVRRSVLAEAAVVGVVGAAVGLLGGVGLAALLRAVLSNMDDSTPTGPLVVAPRTVLVAAAVGVLVTVFAAYLPARRASRVAPMAALRDGAAPSRRGLAVRTAVGAVLVAAGGLALPTGVADSVATVAGSLVALLVGTTMLGPVVARPVVGVLGVPARRLFRVSGRLGTRNAQRNPRRTAATASALMIGLALVTGLGTVAASLKESVKYKLATDIQADYVVSGQDDGGLGPQVSGAVAAVRGVESVASLRAEDVEIGGHDVFVGAVPAVAMGDQIRPDMRDGRSADLADGLFVSTTTAEKYHWRVGQTLTATFGRDSAPLRVAGVFENSEALPPALLPESLARQHFDPRTLPFALLVRSGPGADQAAVRRALDAAVADLPTVSVRTGAEFRDYVAGQADGFLVFVYGLLALAILTAVLGIVNTLALSVFERTREIGLLRAVGLSRRQLRRTVRVEAVLIAVLGAVLGTAVGIGFGVAAQRAAADSGLSRLAIPTAQVVVVVVAAAVVGVLAAVWPARRAARMNTLAAIAAE